MAASLTSVLMPIPTDPVSGSPGRKADQDRISEFIDR
jgi:hypothetical protein